MAKTIDRLKMAAIIESEMGIEAKRAEFNKLLEANFGKSKIAIADRNTDLVAYQEANIEFTNETIGEDWYSEANPRDIKNGLLGCWVVVRTYSAGVHFGKVAAYDDRQNVVITNARRLHLFENLLSTDSISSSVKHGILHTSKLNDEIESIQLNFVELVPTTKAATATFISSMESSY